MKIQKHAGYFTAINLGANDTFILSCKYGFALISKDNKLLGYNNSTKLFSIDGIGRMFPGASILVKTVKIELSALTPPITIQVP